MIKLVKNEFFIYCKETRIESNRSFYGSFSLGPFDSGQSITIANALRRTLLSELKGLAITSAEIEGAFHEYSTLPGVRDSILDILLNLKDIVLKTENYGNKKRGTSYATTFKKTQIGYLKTRGPGIVTASELKLPPGIQCVDPDQYIATLSEEGILNIKLMINEGKNYVLQNSHSPNPNSNPYQGEKNRTEKKDSFLAKDLSGKKLAQKAALKKSVSSQKNIQLLPVAGLVNSGYQPRRGLGRESGFITYINFKRRRLWLHRRNLFKIPSLFLGNKTISKNLPPNETLKPFKSNGEVKTLLGLPTKEAFLCKQKAVKPGLLLPVLTMVKKIRSIRKTTQSETENGALPYEVRKKLDRKLKKKNNLFSFLLIKTGTLRGGIKGFFENAQKYKENSQGSVQGSTYMSLNSFKEVREGGTITATKAVSLVIDAVFMPVNKVNYIIETNEQSVMSSEKNASNLNSTPSFGALKNKPLPIFTPLHSETNLEKKRPLPGYLGFVNNTKPFSFLAKPPLIEESPMGMTQKTEVQTGELREVGLPVLQRKVLIQNRGFYFSKKKILPLPFPIYKNKGLLFFLNNFNQNKYQNAPYFVRVGKKVVSNGSCSGTSSFFVRNNIIISQKKNKGIMSQQLRFLKSCLGVQSFLTFNNKPTSFVKKGGFLPELIKTRVLPRNEQVFHHDPYSIKNKPYHLGYGPTSQTYPKGVGRKKVFLKSAAAQKIKSLGTQLNNGAHTNSLEFSLPQFFPRGLASQERTSLQNPEKIFFSNKMRLSDNQTKTSLKNNIILEIWTNGSIHPRQALYEACKNLLSVFSKLEKATPLAFPQKTPNIL